VEETPPPFLGRWPPVGLTVQHSDIVSLLVDSGDEWQPSPRQGASAVRVTSRDAANGICLMLVSEGMTIRSILSVCESKVVADFPIAPPPYLHTPQFGAYKF